MAFRLRYEQHNLELGLGRTLIGREVGCQILINDPGVSRRHACLTVTPEGVIVEDLGSRNGVFVNGEKVTRPTTLKPGDQLAIGSHRMALSDSKSDRAAASSTPPETLTSLEPIQVLGGMAEKALAMGRPQQAERLLAAILDNALRMRRASYVVDRDIEDHAARLGAKLAAATGKAQWVDYVVEFHSIDARLVAAPIVDDLNAALRKSPDFNIPAFRRYLEALQANAATFTPPERFILKRLEGLLHMATGP